MKNRQASLSPEGFESERWKLVIVVAFVFALAGFCNGQSSGSLHTSRSALRAGTARLTFAQDDGHSLAKVRRRQEPELWYRVTLDDAPIGAPQRLRCQWTDPSGHIVRENHYETKSIDHLPWETYARLRLRADAPLGQWHATLYRSAEKLYELSFEVVDE